VLELANAGARLRIDPALGGRVTSFEVGDHELLRTPSDDPGGLHWGCFVMAPWPGRTRRGHFTFDGLNHTLEINSGAHAIHGTVRDREWEVVETDATAATLRCDFGPHWPFPGWAEHRVTVEDGAVGLALSLHTSAARMPAAGGWHPWWQRRLANGADVALDLPATAMYRRDDGIATGELVSPPPPGPWDDCFTGLTGPPVLRWPGAVELAIESDCPCVVVYDEPEQAVCVEPQSAPPDGLNHGPAVATPGHPVVVHSSWRWSVG
jgi:aldose 1-epimerase